LHYEKNTNKINAAKEEVAAKLGFTTAIFIEKKPSLTFWAPGCLIVNIFIPGLGSMFAATKKYIWRGVWQLGLWLLGNIVGLYPLALAAWIWAIVDGIILIKRGKR
jgi:hypothetical protein